ncbi:ATP-binding cassette domain-containing protein [Treponema sp.]|uniref:ATP-binding cassette domain-containing protein n=1 Tax=Treponema sp. TaxID=166 RepID=UPI00298E0695|nr:ATP-binding cassette domain-containing protein [Treponema sp.]
MNLLSISNLSKIGREEPLFTEVTFGLNEGEKAALIGKNGTGKSTLLNTIAGILQPDNGTVVLNKTGGTSFLPQNPLYEKEDTIRDHIFKSKSPKLEIIREYEELCLNLGSLSQSQQNRYDQICDTMEKQDLWNYEAQISSILSTLGITDMSRKMGSLSGGMIKKVALAQVLVEDTKLLLLDEPTNHLDITTISWLQDYLKNTDRAVLMVTHDRYFLDNVCTNIYELDHHKLKLYQGNYSTYLEKKETENEIAQNTDRRIEAVLRFERDWLLRGPCARGTKAKARIQHDMELINREKFKEDKGFTFEVKGRRLGGKVLELHGISKNFPKGYAGADAGNTTPVIKDFSYNFTAGQKIGIFGNNGTGKSTLLNIITGNLEPDSGTVVVGDNTHFAYYQQNPFFKNTSLTVLEYIQEAAENITMNNGKTYSAARFLEEFGFEGKIQYSPVSTLSGGEKKRLFLVRLLVSNPNFLILDEPTNDFDIFTMNILEQFLEQFQGCLLIVSHDRYFMDKVADTLFILEDNGDISGFVGKCSEYIDYLAEKKKIDAQKESEEKAIEREKQKAAYEEEQKNLAAANPSAKPKKLSFKEQKEFEQLEKDIETLETRKAELEGLMAGPDYSKLAEYTKEYNEVSATLDQKYLRWEDLA